MKKPAAQLPKENSLDTSLEDDQNMNISKQKTDWVTKKTSNVRKPPKAR